MITSHVTITKPVEKPEDMKASIVAQLEASGVTDFEVFLNKIDVDGCYFKIEAADTEDNLATIRTLCGTLNTTASSERITPGMNAKAAREMLEANVGVDVGVGRGRSRSAEPWQIAGSEGRFAKENPPPPWAK